MRTIWTNTIDSKIVTKQLDQLAQGCLGSKNDWGGKTSYSFPTEESREQFFTGAKLAGFDLHTGVSVP
jgi:hypothetical protein